MSLSSASSVLDARMASHLARIALGHVTREHPNAVAEPRATYPIFYGSYDWHSCVHSYWLLATLYRRFPQIAERTAIAALFEDSFTAEKIEGELVTLTPTTARGFERPYGWAWLLMLQAEVLRHDSDWAQRLKPLADLFVA